MTPDVYVGLKVRNPRAVGALEPWFARRSMTKGMGEGWPRRHTKTQDRCDACLGLSGVRREERRDGIEPPAR